MNLDELLAAWADRVALPQDAAAEIGRRILALPAVSSVAEAPPGLPARWWVQHNKQVADLMVRSTRSNRVGLALV
jgi:hypothetical protein